MLNAQQDVRAAGQEEMVAFLSRSETFGGQAVEIVETHASIIFLAGDRAFKLKRAVRYSFLDYSTPERRRDACLAELSINRRFAPDLYLEVQPVVRRPDGLLGFGDGASVPVDWLVVMRRFDAAAQLDRMAEKGELRPELACPLAERIADLHARAEARFNHGGAAGLARAIDITAGNLQSHASEIGADAVWRWTRRARAALRAHTALLDRRRAAGKVRACHGDLHLRNICLLDGRPTPFDAIEFDPDLACIDVLYDLAFLLMDAHARGLDRFGCTVFNKYLDLRQEENGLAALPLFLSVRAAVRAQVNILTAGQAHPAKQKELLREAACYLALARELLEVVPPRLVAIGGLSGTGKSSLAHRLAPALGRVPGGVCCGRTYCGSGPRECG